MWCNAPHPLLQFFARTVPSDAAAAKAMAILIDSFFFKETGEPPRCVALRDTKDDFSNSGIQLLIDSIKDAGGKVQPFDFMTGACLTIDGTVNADCAAHDMVMNAIKRESTSKVIVASSTTGNSSHLQSYVWPHIHPRRCARLCFPPTGLRTGDGIPSFVKSRRQGWAGGERMGMGFAPGGLAT